MKKQDLHPFAAKAGYKDNESFLRDYPTEDSYFQAYPEMKQGGFVQKKGYHWNGQKMVKSTGSNYNAGTGAFFEYGGHVARAYTEKQMKEVPDNWKMYGGDIDAAVPDEMKAGGIHIKKSHEGRFTAYKKRTGKTTEEALHSKDPHVRQMANFSKQAAKWKHEYGGKTFTDWDGRMLEYGGNPFHPLKQLVMAMGGFGPKPEDQQDVYAPEGNQWSQTDNEDTGVIQQEDTSPYQKNQNPAWMNGMHNSIQAQQNIEYGPGSADAYNANTGNTLDIYKPQPQKPRYGDYLGAGMMATAALENRAKDKQMQGYNRSLGQSDYSVTKTVNQFGHGAYDPNYGQLVPGNTYATTKYGGKKMQQGGEVPQLQKGSVVDLDETEINNLIRAGYKFAKA